jgi:CheY-like chemotaxis protein
MHTLKKILLVDDDKAVNFINRLVLQENDINCNIVEATDGQQALDHLEAHDECPDVIFLDINMPGMDGFEFLSALKNRDKCCNHSNIFMLTSSIREEDKARALSSGLVKGYFDKPLSNAHIKQILAGNN